MKREMSDRSLIRLNVLRDEDTRGVWILVVRLAHNFVAIFDSMKTEEKRKNTQKQGPSFTLPIAPYAIMSSTNSEAQAPNPNNGLGQQHPNTKNAARSISNRRLFSQLDGTVDGLRTSRIAASASKRFIAAGTPTAMMQMAQLCLALGDCSGSVLGRSVFPAWSG